MKDLVYSKLECNNILWFSTIHPIHSCGWNSGGEAVVVFGVVQVEHVNRVQTEPYLESGRTELGKLAQSDRTPRPGERFHHRFARLTACHGGAAARPNDDIRILRFMPAMNVNKELIDRAVVILDAALSALYSGATL